MPERSLNFLISIFFSGLIISFTYFDGLPKMSSPSPPKPRGVRTIASTRAKNAIRQIETILKKVKSCSSNVFKVTCVLGRTKRMMNATSANET